MSLAQVQPAHYANQLYNRKGRWVSYWHQIDESLAANPSSCLEIGVGPGVVRDVLRQRGIDVTCVDIDPQLGVERVGDVRALPCDDGEFDVVLCAQVLEHVPLHDVPTAVGELYRVARRRAVVSLPQSGRTYRLSLELPKLGVHHLVRRAPVRRPHRFDGQHHWQVGTPGCRAADVREILRAPGFSVAREYVVPEFTYHRFYVLDKRG
jgi:hypothetical protein